MTATDIATETVKDSVLSHVYVCCGELRYYTRSRLMKELHCTHPGIVKMKLLAGSCSGGQDLILMLKEL